MLMFVEVVANRTHYACQRVGEQVFAFVSVTAAVGATTFLWKNPN